MHASSKSTIIFEDPRRNSTFIAAPAGMYVCLSSYRISICFQRSRKLLCHRYPLFGRHLSNRGDRDYFYGATLISLISACLTMFNRVGNYLFEHSVSIRASSTLPPDSPSLFSCRLRTYSSIVFHKRHSPDIDPGHPLCHWWISSLFPYGFLP